MAEQKIKWHKLADDIDALFFEANNIAVADVKGKKLCIGKFKEELFGFAYKCPHASGVLADGYIDAVGNVVCPLHRYKFSLSNGRNTSGEGYYLKTYPVEVRDAGLFIGLPDGGLFNFW